MTIMKMMVMTVIMIVVNVTREKKKTMLIT